MDNEFKWNDELVREFIEFSRRKLHISDLDIIGADIEKFKKSKNPKYLFTARDGICIHVNDSYFSVADDYSLLISNSGAVIPKYRDRTFGKEENAREYILMNKPLFSVKEIFDTIFTSVESKNRFVELAKEKLK